MSYAERNTWVYGAVALACYLGYLAVVVPQLLAGPADAVSYRAPLVISVAAAIMLGIVGGIVLGLLAPKGEPQADPRDVEIAHLGSRAGQVALIAGAVVALVLAMGTADPFWIANTIYLGFVASAVVSSATRLLAYRGIGLR